MIIKLKYNQGKRVMFPYNNFIDILETLVYANYGLDESVSFMNDRKDELNDETKFLKNMAEAKKVLTGDMEYLSDILEKLDYNALVDCEKQFWTAFKSIVKFGAESKDALIIIGGRGM